MESAAQYRAEAAKCRALAKHARDRMTVANLLALAEDYEKQALHMEPRPAAEPPLVVPD